MPWLNPSGTPEGDERCRRLNEISSNACQASGDQIVAHIRETIRHWPPEERQMLRAWANARAAFEKHYRFHQLRRACLSIPDNVLRLPAHPQSENPPPTPTQYLAAIDSVEQITGNPANNSGL
jgi:hypothetical protein